MTANINPIFTLTPVVGIAQISTANANRDGTGTIGTVITGGTNGTRISRIVVQATGTTTAGAVRLYIYNGVVIALWKEIAVTAITPSATVNAFIFSWLLQGEAALVLPAGYSLRASTEQAEAFNVIAEGGDY